MKFKVGLFFLLMSIVTFILFGWDKFRAQTGGWRVSEKALLGFGIMGGAIGGLLGMRLFHHKTRKSYFAVILTLAAVVQLVLWFWLSRPV